MAWNSGSGGAARGGWSYQVTTENLMKDPGEQRSLSESLRAGAAMAHRRIHMDQSVDNRNFRRSNPLIPLQPVGEGDAPPSRGGSMLPVEAHLRLRRAGHNR